MKHTKTRHNPTPNRPTTGKLELLITIVDRKKAEYYCDIIQEHEVNMQLTCLASGTANKEVLDMLGVHSRDRSVIFSVVRDDRIPEILAVLSDRFDSVKNGKGVAFTVPMDSVIGVAVYGFLANNRRTIKE